MSFNCPVCNQEHCKDPAACQLVIAQREANDLERMRDNFGPDDLILAMKIHYTMILNDFITFCEDRCPSLDGHVAGQMKHVIPEYLKTRDLK